MGTLISYHIICSVSVQANGETNWSVFKTLMRSFLLYVFVYKQEVFITASRPHNGNLIWNGMDQTSLHMAFPIGGSLADGIKSVVQKILNAVFVAYLPCVWLAWLPLPLYWQFSAISLDEHAKTHYKFRAVFVMVTEEKSYHTKGCSLMHGCCLYTHTKRKHTVHYKTICTTAHTVKQICDCLFICLSHRPAHSEPFLQAHWVNPSTWWSCDMLAKWTRALFICDSVSAF